MKGKALNASAGAYLGCIFLIMVGEQYKPVKKFIHKVFFAEK